MCATEIAPNSAKVVLVADHDRFDECAGKENAAHVERQMIESVKVFKKKVHASCANHRLFTE